MRPPLPDFYWRFLSEAPAPLCVEFGDSIYRLPSEADLGNVVNVNGNVTPFWQQWQSWVKMYQELSGEDDTTLLTTDGGEVPFSRLNQCIVIGDDENGDILFVDPLDEFSVWRHFHDGADLEGVASTLREFCECATIVTT